MPQVEKCNLNYLSFSLYLCQFLIWPKHWIRLSQNSSKFTSLKKNNSKNISYKYLRQKIIIRLLLGRHLYIFLMIFILHNILKFSLVTTRNYSSSIFYISGDLPENFTLPFKRTVNAFHTTFCYISAFVFLNYIMFNSI